MRIGFVLAEMSTGSSATLLTSLTAAFPDASKDCIVLFPGGRLNSTTSLEGMKNSIYSLVNPGNLDGTILWSSSLTGSIGPETVFSRFREMTELPMVTIDGKTQEHPDIPDIRFNAYEGSRFLVNHLLKVHNVSTIAYIRGPLEHHSAQERFQSYVDTLEESGVGFHPELVSDPMPWNKGDQAMAQLLEERHLVPGKDFQAFMCASDYMMYHAVRVLEKHGYSIPEDVIACGFNDSIEARMLSVPATTVRLPYTGLGRGALLTYQNLCSGYKCSDRLLPMAPVIRRSCGCNGSGELRSPMSLDELANAIAENHPIALKDARFMIRTIAEKATESNIMAFLEALSASGADVFEISDIIGCFSTTEEIAEGARRKISDKAREVLPFELDRFVTKTNYGYQNQRFLFRVFCNELLEANSANEISRIVKSHSAPLGFAKIELVLTGEGQSTLVETGQKFSSSEIAPKDREDLLDNGIWVVAPLCTETDYMGYLLMKIHNSINGFALEEIRSSVSSSLKSALQFEKSLEDRRVAQEAESARTSFFASVGANIRSPLGEIARMVKSSRLDEGSRKAVEWNISNIQYMLDLTLASTGELELDLEIRNIGTLLEGFPSYRKTMALPCILIDEKRITEAIQAIVSIIGDTAEIHACMERRGVRIEISDTSGNWTADIRDSRMELAQKVLLFHGGSYTFGKGCLSACLPYPTLGDDAGRPSVGWKDGQSLVCIGEAPDAQLLSAMEGPGLSPVATVTIGARELAARKHLPANAGAVYWDASLHGYNAVSALQVLSSDRISSQMPFICMDVPVAKTLLEALGSGMETLSHVILQVGFPSGDFMQSLLGGEILSCDLPSALSLCRRQEPALVALCMQDLSCTEENVLAFLGSLRTTKRISQTPVIIVTDRLDEDLVDKVCEIPNVILANSCMQESPLFIARLRDILAGAPLLAPQTGAILKKAQAFMCTNATMPISRWQVADHVHVSEDYLARLFKKELGLSPWDYLNRYRVHLSIKLLGNTAMSVNEIALATGFQDQAYFCRVFKRICGCNPGRIRQARRLAVK